MSSNETGDVVASIFRAIAELSGSYPDRSKKVVSFSTDIDPPLLADPLLEEQAVCDLFVEWIEKGSNESIKFIQFNVHTEHADFHINNYLECLTNNNPSKLFGLPSPITIDKFHGVSAAFQKAICHESEAPMEQCDCHQVVFDSVYNNHYPQKHDDRYDCDGKSNCNYSPICYTYSVIQNDDEHCQQQTPSYIILSPKSDCGLEMDQWQYKKVLKRIFDTKTGKNIDYDVIYDDRLDLFASVNGIKIPIKYLKHSKTYKFTICLYGITQFVTSQIGYGFELLGEERNDYGYHCTSTYLPDLCQDDNGIYSGNNNVNHPSTRYNEMFYSNSSILIISVSIMFGLICIFICKSCIKAKQKKYYNSIKREKVNEDDFASDVDNDEKLSIYQ